jgi:hypothetical protein
MHSFEMAEFVLNVKTAMQTGSVPSHGLVYDSVSCTTRS